VSDEIMVDMIKHELDTNKECKNGYVDLESHSPKFRKTIGGFAKTCPVD
jgi:adenylate kinase